MTDPIPLPWQAFFLQTITLHWLSALVLVVIVASSIAVARRLNATTRHNIWLLTLTSVVLMPLLVFVPRPEPPAQQGAAADGFRIESTDKVASAVQPAPRTIVASDPDRIETGRTALSIRDNLTGTSTIQVLLAIWLTGSVLLSRRLWREYLASRLLARQSMSITPYLEQRFSHLCVGLNIDKRPSVRFHEGIHAPMTVGMINVWIAIPAKWRDSVDDKLFDQTLTHELGHIARRDPVIHLMQRILVVVLWMYPAVWYVSRQLELERESACDDWVLTHDGKGHCYASNLLDVAESLYSQPDVLAVGCLRSHSQLSRRIQNLLNTSSDHKVNSSKTLLAVTTTALFAALSVSAFAWPDARQLRPPEPPAEPQAPVVAKTAPTADAHPIAAPTPINSPVPIPAPEAPPAPESAPAPDAVPSPVAVPVPVSAPSPPQRPAATVAARRGRASMDSVVVPDSDDLRGSAEVTNTVRADSSTAPSAQSISGLVIERWPVRTNRISKAYGEYAKKDENRKNPHAGLDFPIRQGAPIRTVASGRVELADFSESYGLYVVIDHGNGYKTKYANNQVNMVKQGDYVETGQQIATVGNTSRNSTGPHLHFEVRLNGHSVDPESLYSPGK